MHCGYSQLLHTQDDTAQVRILKVALRPDEKSNMRSHPATVAVFLSDGKGRFTFPDGTSQDFVVKTSDAMYSAATAHLPQNTGDQPLDLIVIELKGKSAKAAQAVLGTNSTAVVYFPNIDRRGIRREDIPNHWGRGHSLTQAGPCGFSSDRRCSRSRRPRRVGDSYRLIRVAGTPDHDKKQGRSKQQSERADDCRQLWAAAQCEVEAEQRDGRG
jgi:quercetin dioxygenase-like cupin family protein